MPTWNDIDPTGGLERAVSRMFAYSPDGEARHTLWSCPDGWIVGYTTERIRGGRFDGRFAAMAYKPVGKGARTGKASEWQRVYFRGFAKRKSARARAEALYDQHRKG